MNGRIARHRPNPLTPDPVQEQEKRLGLGVEGFRVQGLGFQVQGLRFRGSFILCTVQGFRNQLFVSRG